MFHLVSDDTLLLGDINSRHSVILGIRNILKACFKYSIMTLTIPLLLTMEMTEVSKVTSCGFYVIIFGFTYITSSGL